MHRIVAVKMLPTGMMKNPAVVARFEREVTAAAKLNHPNIVTAFDADNANGVHLLIMEYVEGSDLSALVKKSGPLSVDEAVNCILQTARGLEAAHAAGIVHRDIKPANLLLDKKGVVKILDMGLARLTADVDSERQAELTNTGAVMGTVDYMAPEQALDTKTADARADIYALGCSLFYLLIGQAVYQGDTVMKKLLAHREQPIPSIRALRPEVSEPVEAVFWKMVAKRVEDRYQTMTEVLADLESCGIRHDQPVNTQPLFDSSTDAGITNFLKEISAGRPNSIQMNKSHGLLLGKTKKQLLAIGGGVLGVLVLLAAFFVNPKTKDLSSSSPPPAKPRTGGEDPAASDAENRTDTTQDPAFRKWMLQVAGLSAEEQVGVVVKRLKDLNQGFDGKETHQVESGVVTELQFASDNIADISPVRVLTGLQSLTCSSTRPPGKLANLSPLKGLLLTHLNCAATNVADLSPLAGMRLTRLDIHGAPVTDLTPLAGMPLTELICTHCPVTDLSPLEGMPLTFLSCSTDGVSDIAALRGMPLEVLDLTGTGVADLSPLRDMPTLKSLNIRGSRVWDLSPLAGLRLGALYCSETPAVDLTPLRKLPLKVLHCDFRQPHDYEIVRAIATLETIISKPAADFWKEFETRQAAFDAWMKQIAEMPAEQQVKAVAAKLKHLNLGYDGKVSHREIEGGGVTGLTIVTDKVTDISPIRALPGLRRLSIDGTEASRGRLADLSPLRGMSLTYLSCGFCEVADLSPLEGMPLAQFNCIATPLSDLTPLKMSPLILLYCQSSRVVDLTPLEGLPLIGLGIAGTGVSGMEPLRGMDLEALHLDQTTVSDLSPIKSKSLRHLTFSGTRVADLAPLQEMPLLQTVHCSATPVNELAPVRMMSLVSLACDFSFYRDAEGMRSMKTLSDINYRPAAEFWKDVDAAQAAFEAWAQSRWRPCRSRNRPLRWPRNFGSSIRRLMGNLRTPPTRGLLQR